MWVSAQSFFLTFVCEGELTVVGFSFRRVLFRFVAWFLSSVQLWTVNNYHWYLKQEISSLSVDALNFTSVEWHPEQPFKIAVLTARQSPFFFFLLSLSRLISFLIVFAGSLEIRSFCWDTYATVAPAPNDTGLVAVVDGGAFSFVASRSRFFPSLFELTTTLFFLLCHISLPPPNALSNAKRPSSDVHLQSRPPPNVFPPSDPRRLLRHRGHRRFPLPYRRARPSRDQDQAAEGNAGEVDRERRGENGEVAEGSEGEAGRD